MKFIIALIFCLLIAGPACAKSEWRTVSPEYDLSSYEGHILQYAFNQDREDLVWRYNHYYLRFWEVSAEFTGLYNIAPQLVRQSPGELVGHHIEIVQAGDTLEFPYSIGLTKVILYAPTELMQPVIPYALDRYNQSFPHWLDNYEIPLLSIITGDTPLMHNPGFVTDMMDEGFWTARGFNCVSLTTWSVLYGLEMQYGGIRDVFINNMAMVNWIDSFSPDKAMVILNQLGLYEYSEVLIIGGD